MACKKFIDTIVERENRLGQIIDGLKSNNDAPYIYIYIYGAGVFADTVRKNLEENNIFVEGNFVDMEYYCGEANLKTVEEVFESTYKKVVVFVANSGYYEGKLDKYADKIKEVVWIDNAVYFFPLTPISFIEENEAKFQNFYDKLEDDLSRKTVSAFLNQKISGLCGHLSKLKSKQSIYFENDFVTLGTSEVFVDCGAYIGDTALTFIDELKMRNIDSYRRIICFEPDEMNFMMLQALNLKNATLVKRGVSYKAETVNFLQNGTGLSSISESGNVSVEVDTIDNVLKGEEATFIKMDIEGAELSALKGAAKTIRKYKPTIAVSLYHKKEDIIEIPEYIHALVPEYRFYCRAYYDYSFDLVLYAIPPQK